MMMRQLDDEEPSPSSGGWWWWWWDIPFFRWMSMMIGCLPFSGTFRRVDASAGVGVNIGRQSRWWWITIPFFRWMVMMMMMCHPLLQVDDDVMIRRLFVAWSATTLPGAKLAQFSKMSCWLWRVLELNVTTTHGSVDGSRRMKVVRMIHYFFFVEDFGPSSVVFFLTLF